MKAEREKLINEADRLDEESRLLARHIDQRSYNQSWHRIQDRMAAIATEVRDITDAPIQLEGFVGFGEDNMFIGCPDGRGDIDYKWYNDLSEILYANRSRYIKITIEAPNVADRRCGSCRERFKCFTSRE